MKILLVEHSNAMHNNARSMLAQSGYTNVEEAASGREALQRLKLGRPDLLIVDSRLPAMDGLTFVAMFRQIDQETPVIMVSTDNQKSSVVAAVRAGVTAYLVKPITADSLSARIADATLKSAAA